MRPRPLLLGLTLVAPFAKPPSNNGSTTPISRACFPAAGLAVGRPPVI